MIERVPKLFLEILKNRLTLFSLELQEEKSRFKHMIVLSAVGSMLGLVGFIGLGILIMSQVQEADRVLVASIIVGVFITSAIVLMVVSRILISRQTPFEATLATLEIDVNKQPLLDVPNQKLLVVAKTDVNRDSFMGLTAPIFRFVRAVEIGSFLGHIGQAFLKRKKKH